MIFNRFGWQGFPPPAALFRSRRFLGVALDPPDYNPGSWIGAGKAWFDPGDELFYLTARPRTAADDVRGYAARIFTSKNGVDFGIAGDLTIETVNTLADTRVHSIEGTQLLRDPATGRWYFYLSVDTGDSFVWGGVQWETMIFSAHQLEGPWSYEGFALRNGTDIDAHQARDATIDIVDGRWLCLYKAKDANRDERPALAVSRDGLSWEKRGKVSIDGADAVCFLNGSMFATASGPMFLGVKTRLDDSRERKTEVVYADEHGIGHGGGPRPMFAAYRFDESTMNLETVFEAPWFGMSDYEHAEHPLLGYSSMAYDAANNRFLCYLEALDPELTEAIGINSTVERVVVYEMKAF